MKENGVTALNKLKKTRVPKGTPKTAVNLWLYELEAQKIASFCERKKCSVSEAVRTMILAYKGGE